MVCGLLAIKLNHYRSIVTMADNGGPWSSIAYIDAIQALDSEYLGLQCHIHHSPPDSYISPTTLFTTDIFGISPRDDSGNVRILGFTIKPNRPAVFWIVEITSYGPYYVVRSNYEVILVEIDTSGSKTQYIYVIHPVPIDELHVCELFYTPEWHVEEGREPVELIEVNRRNGAWELPTGDEVHITGWVP